MQPEVHKELHPGVKDIVLGLSDGLTVPFAIAAGLAGIAANSGVIIVAAILSEMAAGAISMGLGGYLASNTESRHYKTERGRQERQIETHREYELEQTKKVFEGFGIADADLNTLVTAVTKDPKSWADFMMKFELGLDEPDQREALYSGLRVGISYAVGGLFPLVPYAIFYQNVPLALKCSIAITFVALLIFGAVRAKIIGDKPWWSMVQTVLLVGIAALAAFIFAKFAPHL